MLRCQCPFDNCNDSIWRVNLDQSRAPGPEHLQYTDMVTNTDDISLRCDHVTRDDTSNGDNHNNNTHDGSQYIEKKILPSHSSCLVNVTALKLCIYSLTHSKGGRSLNNPHKGQSIVTSCF